MTPSHFPTPNTQTLETAGWFPNKSCLEGEDVTEPSAVAPDARVKCSLKQFEVGEFPVNPSVIGGIHEVDASIRRYRARFCKDVLSARLSA